MCCGAGPFSAGEELVENGRGRQPRPWPTGMAGSPAAAIAMAMTTHVLQACLRVYVSVRHPGGAISRFERHPWPWPAAMAVSPHRRFLWCTYEIAKTDKRIPLPVLRLGWPWPAAMPPPRKKRPAILFLIAKPAREERPAFPIF